jgi:signal transduction histidine kinase
MAIATLMRVVDPRRQAHRLRRWLVLTVPGAIASVLLLAGVLLYLQAAAERRAIEERAQDAASAMAFAIEREIAASLALLRGLASSPALRAGNLRAYYDQLIATEVPDGTWLVLSDADRHVLNTSRKYGEPLPTIPSYGPEAAAAVERIHRLGWSVSGRVYGLVSNMYVVLVNLSVPQPDVDTKYILSLRLSEKRVETLLAEPVFGARWTGCIVDRHGRLLRATPPNTGWNAPLERHWLADVLPLNVSGLIETLNPANTPVRVAYAKAPNVAWTAAVEVPLEVINAPVVRMARNLAMGGGLLLALGTIAGGLLARSWQRPIDELSAAAAHGESKRREAEAQTEHTRGLLRASSNALPARLAVLDARGNVVFTNEAWRHFARSRLVSGDDYANYLKVCEAPVLRDALRRLMKGKRRRADATYRIEGPPDDRWYQAHLARFEHQDKTWFVIAHEDITEVKAAKQAVHHLTDRLASLQEEERQRIARELHDSTAQHLVSIGLSMMRLRSSASPAAREAICRDINACLQEAQKELRLFTYLLYPPSLESEGLKAIAERFVDGFGTRAGLKIRCKIEHDADRASLEVQRALFRVLQEALTNVHRHAGATRVLVLLQASRQELRLFVKDNGKGFGNAGAARKGHDVSLGLGIPSMRARLRQLGGTLTVTSARRGTVVRAFVCLRPQHERRHERSDKQVPSKDRGIKPES